MKLILCTLLSLCTLYASANSAPTVLTFKFNGATESIRIMVKDKTVTVSPDHEGNASIHLTIESPQYVKLIRSKIPELLYLYPGDQLNIELVGQQRKELLFSGKGAVLNDYLVKHNSPASGYGFGVEEAAYMQQLNDKVASATAVLAELKLSKDFVNKEEKRIKARIYSMLVTYPPMRKREERTYRPSAAYNDFVRKVLFEDREMLVLNEYKDFIQYLYQLLGTKDIMKYDALAYAKGTMQYVIENVKDTAVRSHLINYYSYDFLKRNGIDQIAEITPIFKRYVKDAANNKLYDSTIVIWSKVSKGSKMREYNFYDKDGRLAPLSSFNGKYVYIDMWATWCKPCIAEIPHLKKLEAALEGRNIHFVSISTDSDVEAWTKMLKEDNFTGIQLHARDRDFSKDLMIVSIPRFVLIDPDGKMVESNMSRPSKPETLEFLKGLPGM